MKAEILTIGDEILLGQTINTNASYISKKLTEIGIEVKWITTIGDDNADLTYAISIAEKRADVIISTGGLGPTHDDMTKKIFADYFNSPLIVHEPTLKKVTAFFKKLGIDMPKTNLEQALVPDKAIVIENRIGTAPGLLFQNKETFIFILPGVPMEMKNIMELHVIPFLKNKSDKFIKYSIIKTIGIGESSLFEKIGDIEELEKFVKIAFLPKSSGVEIRLTSIKDNETECLQNIEKVKKLISSKILEYIWGYDDENIENIIGHILIKEKKSLAICEMYTGGLITHKLTNLADVLKYLKQSIIITNIASLKAIPGIAQENLTRKNGVNEEVALALARYVRTTFDAAFGMAVTNVYTQASNVENIPIGEFYSAVANHHDVTVRKFTLKMDQKNKKERVAQLTLDMLRRELTKR